MITTGPHLPSGLQERDIWYVEPLHPLSSSAGDEGLQQH